MRIAVLIIGLVVAVLSGLQSCTVLALSTAVSETATSESAGLGMLMAFLFVLGAGFVLAYPRVSAVTFVLGAGLGFLASSGEQFDDLAVWATGGLFLAGMSYWGSRELRRKQVKSPAGEPSI